MCFRHPEFCSSNLRSWIRVFNLTFTKRRKKQTRLFQRTLFSYFLLAIVSEGLCVGRTKGKSRSFPELPPRERMPLWNYEKVGCMLCAACDSSHWPQICIQGTLAKSTESLFLAYMAASSFVMLWGCLCLGDHRKYWLENKAFKCSTEEEVEHVACFHGECFDSCSCFMKRCFDNYSCCVNRTFLSKRNVSGVSWSCLRYKNWNIFTW